MKYQALAAALALSAQAAPLTVQSQQNSARPTIVLVHGGFVDGSGWAGVFENLRKDGYNVAIVQNPTISLAGDVAATKSVIDAQPGPVILVGHSYWRRRHHRSGQRPQGRRARLHRRFCARQRPIRRCADQDFPGGRPTTSDPSAARRLPVSRQGQVRRRVRRRRRRENRCVHGRVASAMGAGRPDRRCYASRVEEQAQLVSGCYGRPYDSAGGAADHVQASRRHRGRDEGKSCPLCVAPKACR